MQSSVLRLVFALVLAIVAGGANILWLNFQRPKTTEYLVFQTDVKYGETILRDHLDTVALPSDNKRLREVFVAKKNREIIENTKAVHNYAAGDMVQHKDIHIAGEPPEYRILGPFRLISVGDRIVDALNQDTSSSDSSGTSVTVAAKYSAGFDFDLHTRRLLQIIAASQTGSRDKFNDLEILAVVAYPEKAVQQSTNTQYSLGLQEDEIALFVPMPNVPTIPNVILTNKSPRIGFVVPASVLSSEELATTSSFSAQK